VNNFEVSCCLVLLGIRHRKRSDNITISSLELDVRWHGCDTAFGTLCLHWFDFIFC